MKCRFSSTACGKNKKARSSFPHSCAGKVFTAILALAAILWNSFPLDANAEDKQYEINKVLNRESIIELFDPKTVEMLERRGFVILDDNQGDGRMTRWKHFYEIYESLRYEDQPAFVTTDATLHYAHEVLSFTIENLEESTLMTCTEELLKALVEGTKVQTKSAPSPEMKEAATGNLALASIALTLLKPEWRCDSLVEEMVRKEKALILKAEGEATSPLLGYVEDYSQFKPRGHYTRSAKLKRFFLATMWMGKAELKPKEDRNILQGLLLTLALTNTGAGEKNGFALWKRLNKVTEAFTGPCDNPSPADYLEIAKKIWGHTPNLEDIGGGEKIDQFYKEGRILSKAKPRIVNPVERNPETGEIERDPNTGEALQTREEGFRILGQRFIADAYILQQLVYPKVGTFENPRNVPSGLDIMAVLGSAQAEKLQMSTQKSFKNYETRLASLQKEFSAIPEATWSSNAYWMWLSSLRHLFSDKSGSHPPFMRSPDWEMKSLNTALGSWTELRHDTILYAKTSVAEGGEGRHFMPMVLAQGYVEPEPEVYSEIGKVCTQLRTLLEKEHLMTKPVKEIFSPYESVVKSLHTISRKELQGHELTAGEYNVVREFGRVMEQIHKSISQAKESQRGSQIEESTMAVVADVHTDLVGGVCLEEGVGLPREILAIAPLNGKPVIVRGAVFSQYEFIQPTSGRLTDEEWEQMLYEGKTPPGHQWLSYLIARRDTEALYGEREKQQLPADFPEGIRANNLVVRELKQISWARGGGDFAPRYPRKSRWGYSGNDQIVYYSKNPRGFSIWVTKPDGTGQMALTPEGTIAIDPCWLPFECKLVFSAAPRDGAPHNLVLYDYEISEVYEEKAAYPYTHKTAQLTSTGKENISPASFDIDGGDYRPEERVLYSSNISGRYQLYILDPGTTNPIKVYPLKSGTPGTRGTPRRLTDLAGDNYQGVASPDGKKVAFTSRRDGREDIWIITMDGKNARQLTKNAGSNSQPAWSPDGKLVTFVSDRDGGSDIWVMNADGTEPTRLTDSKEADMSPCWATSPWHIVFASMRGGASCLWLMTLEVKK